MYVEFHTTFLVTVHQKTNFFKPAHIPVWHRVLKFVTADEAAINASDVMRTLLETDSVYVYHNIEVRSRNHCSQGKATYCTGCPRRNVPDFGRMFLMLKYTDITQNTYVQSWTITEIMTREVWNFDSCYTLIDYQIHIKTGKNMWFL